MSGKRTLSIDLDPVEYEQLQAEAARRGIDASALAQAYLHNCLAENGKGAAEERRRRGLAALEKLRALTAGLPPVDALEVARASREDLERRSMF